MFFPGENVLLNLMKVLSLGCPGKVRSGAMCYIFLLLLQKLQVLQRTHSPAFQYLGFFFYLISQNAENKTIIFQNQLPVAFLKPQDQTPLLCKQAQTCEIAGDYATLLHSEGCPNSLDGSPAAQNFWWNTAKDKETDRFASDQYFSSACIMQWSSCANCSGHTCSCSSPFAKLIFSIPPTHKGFLWDKAKWGRENGSGAKKPLVLSPTGCEWLEARKKCAPTHGGTSYQVWQLCYGEHFIP